MKKKRKMWHSGLTTAEKQHLKEGAGLSLVSIDGFKRTIAGQRKEGIDCFQCRMIAKKLGV